MEEKEHIAPDWDDEAWELYRTGYSLTGELKRERAGKLMDCFPAQDEYLRKRADFCARNPWCSIWDYDSLIQDP